MTDWPTWQKWRDFVNSLSREDLEAIHGACCHRMEDLPTKYPRIKGLGSGGGDPFVAREKKQMARGKR